MAPVTVTTSATVVVAPGQANRFIAVSNPSAQIVYVSWDGTVPTVANGFPIPATTGQLILQGAEMCAKGMQAIVAATTSDFRVQAG